MYKMLYPIVTGYTGEISSDSRNGGTHAIGFKAYSVEYSAHAERSKRYQ